MEVIVEGLRRTSPKNASETVRNAFPAAGFKPVQAAEKVARWVRFPSTPASTTYGFDPFPTGSKPFSFPSPNHDKRCQRMTFAAIS